MKNRIIAALAFTSLVVLTTSFARDASAQAPGSGFEPTYGTAGCGLGSMLIGSKPGIVQIFASTTNGLLGTQTFGITSGTSNCNSSAPSGMAARQFIETNRQAFAKDASRGSGETIVSLATLSGCRDAKAVGVTLQKNFTVIFPGASASDTDVSTAAVSSLKADKSLACTAL